MKGSTRIYCVWVRPYFSTSVCFVCLTWMVFEIGGRCRFVECCLQDLFNTARSIFVQLLSSFFSIRLVSVHVVHSYSSIDTIAAWKNCFILSSRSDFSMTNSLSIAVHAFASHVLISFSIDETLLLRSVSVSTSFRNLPLSVEMSPLWLKLMSFVLSALTWRAMLARCPFQTM